MPELPEVETVASQLAPLLTGRKIRRTTVCDPKLDDAQLAKLAGYSIERVFRHGKQVALQLSKPHGRPPARYMLVHLRMTGRLIWDTGTGDADPRHLRATFALEGGRLLFYDQRRFGTITVAEELAAQVLPVDPLSTGLNLRVLQELLACSRQPLKAWLMRQDKLVGIGNIYASEILFAARLHPQRPANTLSREEVQRLLRSIRAVLRLAVKHCGTTFSDFQDAHGLSGGFQRLLQVYGREGQSCSVCGTAVERIVQQQRSTYFCPRCQS